MCTVINACAMETINSLPSESDESDMDDTPVKRRKTEYKVPFFVVLSWY